MFLMVVFYYVILREVSYSHWGFMFINIEFVQVHSIIWLNDTNRRDFLTSIFILSAEGEVKQKKHPFF